MYPDLSYVMHDLLGTSPDNWISIFKTFGLLLVLAIVSAAITLYWELKRKRAEGLFQPTYVKELRGLPATPWEIASNAFFGFFLGFKLIYIAQHFAEFQADAADVLISSKGNLLAGIAGAALFGFIRYYEKKKEALPQPKEVTIEIWPEDRIGDITVTAAVSGIAGAKIFDLLENLPAFFRDPIGMFFSGSGLAIYGGLIGGFLGVTWYLRKFKVPFWPVADAVAPGLMLSYGIGRIGCQLSGDGDWGIAAGEKPSWWFLPDWLWSYTFPHNVNNQGIPLENCEFKHCFQLAEAVYPTAVYETIMAVAIFGLLWALRKRIKVPGMIFFIYLILNGLERFTIEKIRVNKLYDLGFVQATQAEMIAVVFLLIGGIGIWWVRKNHSVINS